MTKFESGLSQALELDADERHLLAMRLEMSLDETGDPGYDAAWEAEIKRRVEEVERGEADEMEWEDTMKVIFRD